MVDATVDQTPVMENGPIREMRDYFCRVCDTTTRARTIPLNWLVVRKTFSVDEGPRTVGIYDSVECMLIGVTNAVMNIRKNGSNNSPSRNNHQN